jgi:multiple sugar transport system permease protein
MDQPIDGHFVGAANYINLLHNEIFRRAAMNTLRFTCISVPLNMLLSLMLASVLHRVVYWRSPLRIGFVLPLVIPVASVVLVWQVLFGLDGALNGWLVKQGLAPQDWLDSSKAMYILILVYLWKNIGYNMILFLAGLHNIPAEYYEAASIDGAGAIRKWFSITLVYLTPTTFFVFIMSIINSFKVFRETYLLTGEYPHESIYMLQHFMNNMFRTLDYQKLTSASLLMSLIIIVLVFVFYQVERRITNSIR